jgi:TolB-like protein/Tfp pilus assembly protein PilF
MAVMGLPSGTIHFGPFEVDGGARVLRKRGLRIKLRRQSFDILSALLEHPGETVTREDLRRRLWPETIFVDFEDSLNSAVKRLRSALGDSAVTPKYVETIPRVGYRFMARAESAAKAGGGALRMLVLPFSNLSGEPAQDYLSDGLTEEVTGQLALLDPSLAVIARTSAMHYKGSRKGIAAIAVELNLDYVLEGSVRRSEGWVRVAAQLIDARRETHLWANSFEGELTDFLHFQCEIAQAVARDIRLQVVPPVVAAVATEAYDAYIRAISHASKFTPSELTASVKWFEAAIAIEPRFAKAWARLAVIWAHMALWTYAPGREAFPKAEAAARRALELDERLADAHEALGTVDWFYHWDMEASARELERAVQLNPSSAFARTNWSIFLASMKSDFERANLEAVQAQALDPLSPGICAHVGWIYYWGRQFGRAIRQCRRALELDPRSLTAYYILGLSQMGEGQLGESIATFETCAATHGDSLSLSYLASACGLAGERQRAESLLAELECRSKSQSVPATCLAAAHLGLGNLQIALDYLERALEEHDTHLLMLRVSARWDPLRQDPRFIDLLRKLPHAEEVSDPRGAGTSH